MTYNEIYEIVKKIPRGKVATYGQIAKIAGCTKGARAVGNAMHNNPTPGPIPCHRVVNNQGKLACHFAAGGLKGQKLRLEAEGVIVENYTVDLDIYQWQE